LRLEDRAGASLVVSTIREGMMSPSEYDFLSVFLLRSSGLTRGAQKQYLLESRLMPLAQSWGLLGIPELVETLKKGSEPRLATAVAEAMTLNEATFFRDKQSFEDLKTVILPTLLQSRRSSAPLRIWVPGCSTGQEPYSMAMTIADHFPPIRTRPMEILASDIDSEMMARAERGVYSQFEVQRGLPIRLLLRHLDQLPDRAGWRINLPLRERITWLRLSLLESLTSIGRLDLIFCRNVLVAFEPTTRQTLLSRLVERLAPDGFLVLGAGEASFVNGETLQRRRDCKSTVYRPMPRKSVLLTASMTTA
jgi:chemotaxis protein methyltransferase CheR